MSVYFIINILYTLPTYITYVCTYITQESFIYRQLDNKMKITITKPVSVPGNNINVYWIHGDLDTKSFFPFNFQILRNLY